MRDGTVERSVLEVLPILRRAGFNAFHQPGLPGFISALFPEGLPLIERPDETLHNPGGRRPVQWSATSEVVAKFSPCSVYRYALIEVWDVARPLWMWVMMNPSMAGLRYSDSTVNHTSKISRFNGAGGQIICNSGAYRSTKPDDLRGRDAVGPDNVSTIMELLPAASRVILGYGLGPAELVDEGPRIANMLVERQSRIYVLRRRIDGRPMHPLARGRNRIPVETVPVRWDAA